jgi:hypothetical protein
VEDGPAECSVHGACRKDPVVLHLC